jgi:hypothetical protein
LVKNFQPECTKRSLPNKPRHKNDPLLSKLELVEDNITNNKSEESTENTVKNDEQEEYFKYLNNQINKTKIHYVEFSINEDSKLGQTINTKKNNISSKMTEKYADIVVEFCPENDLQSRTKKELAYKFYISYVADKSELDECIYKISWPQNFGKTLGNLSGVTPESLTNLFENYEVKPDIDNYCILLTSQKKDDVPTQVAEEAESQESTDSHVLPATEYEYDEVTSLGEQ